MKRFVVEGAWLEGNDGSPVTRDFVVANSADDATGLVERVRERLEPWQADTALEFDEFIAGERAILDGMAGMALEDVEASWAETKRNLGQEGGWGDGETCECGRGAHDCATADDPDAAHGDRR